MKHKIIQVFLFFVFPFSIVLPQSNSEYAGTDHYKENMYIFTHTDFVITGDSLLFTLYCFDENTGMLSDLSSFAYIECIDPSGEPVIQNKIQLKKGIGSGYLNISENLKIGNYLIRAYTPYMKNFNPNAWFTKKIAIFNPKIELQHPSNVYISNYVEPVLELYPENKFICYNRENKITIKFTNKYGKGFPADLILISDKTDSIQSFKIDESGLAEFSFFPISDHSYSLNIKHKGKSKQISLRKYFKDCEYYTSFKKDNEGYHVTLFCQDKYFSGNIQCVSASGQTMVDIPISTSTSISQNIQFSQLQQGLNSISLIDSDSNTIFSRIVFVKPETPDYKIEIKNSQSNPIFQELHLKFSNQNLFDSFSNISATLALNTISSHSLYQFMYISRFIETNYDLQQIFTAENIPVEHKLDLLLSSTSLLKASMEYDNLKYFPINTGWMINGTIKPRDQKSGRNNIEVIGAQLESYDQLHYSLSDTTGKFKFDFPEIPFDQHTMLFFTPDTSNEYVIQIDAEYINHLNYLIPPLAIDADQSMVAQQLMYNQIIYRNYPNQTNTLHPTNNKPFYGKPDRKVLLSDYQRLPIMEEVFIELFPDIFIKRSKEKYHLSMLDKYTKRIIGPSPLVLLDGIPIPDHSLIFGLDVKDIYSIETVNSRYFLKKNSFDGIISIKSTDGNILDAIDLPYSHIREFIQPFIADNNLKNYKIKTKYPDFRSIILYESSLSVSENGTCIITFKKADYQADFVLKIEGILYNGVIFSISKEIKL